jgi:hypothetical protein
MKHGALLLTRSRVGKLTRNALPVEVPCQFLASGQTLRSALWENHAQTGHWRPFADQLGVNVVDF